MTESCCRTDNPMTVRELAKRYPSLLNGPQPQREINELLAECGYRLAEAQDIIRAQSGGHAGLQDFLACRVVKIIACI